MPSAAIAATSDPLTVDSNIKFCCDPRRRRSRARLPCCSWLRHTIDSLLTPPRIRSGKNLFVTLLSTLGFLNRSGQIYIKSWGAWGAKTASAAPLKTRASKPPKQKATMFSLWAVFIYGHVFVFICFVLSSVWKRIPYKPC